MPNFSPKPFGRRPTPVGARHTPTNAAEALPIGELIRRANGGDVLAMRAVGAAHDVGSNDAPVDLGEAARWYLRADAAGDEPSSYRLAQMYENGHGVRKDHLEAIKRYRQLAEKGHVSSLCNLGALYMRGEDTIHNVILAYACFRLAAPHDNDFAVHNLGQMWQVMSVEQMREGNRIATKWEPGRPLPRMTELSGDRQPRTETVVLGLLRPLLKSLRELKPGAMSVVEAGFKQAGNSLVTTEDTQVFGFYQQLIEFGWALAAAPPEGIARLQPDVRVVTTTAAGCKGVAMLFESILRDVRRAAGT